MKKFKVLVEVEATDDWLDWAVGNDVKERLRGSGWEHVEATVLPSPDAAEVHALDEMHRRLVDAKEWVTADGRSAIVPLSAVRFLGRVWARVVETTRKRGGP